jgi:hypothetical protein
MGKKSVVVLVIIAAMIFVVFLKIGLLFSTNKEVKLGEQSVETSTLPAELETLKTKITDGSLTNEERFLAIDAMTRLPHKDLAIVTLEKLEENQKNTPMGDRLRRAVVALRYNKPVEELKKNEKPSQPY